MPEKGSLAEKPGAEIFREMVDTGRGGILRVSLGKQIKVVVFEEGRPVFALSNVPEDQLDVLLVRQRKITPDQAKAIKSRIQKEQELPGAIVAAGLLDDEGVLAARIDQVERVIQSVMRWTEGEFLLDTSARAPHDITIDAPVDQWLLDTARSVSPEVALAQLGGLDARYVARPVENGSLELSPLDGFLLSRISEPMSIGEIQDGSGLPEDQCLPVLYAMYASRMIVPADGESGRPGARGAGSDSEDDLSSQSVDEIRADLDHVITRYRDAELYDILEVTRRAEPIEIKNAYYQLAKRFHPDRYHHVSDPEIRTRLEAIFLQISRAYDTLKDSRLRADYDRRIGAGSSAPVQPITRPAPPPPPPPPPARPVQQASSASSAQRSAAAGTPRSHSDSPSHSASLSGESSSATMHTASEVSSGSLPKITPHQSAEANFEEGQKRFQQRDVIGAVHFFREALRHNPDKGAYHLALGSALATNARWYKEAEKHLLEASRSEPLNTQIFLLLGQIYRGSGLTKRAEAQYRQVLGVDPRNPAARQALVEMGLDVPGGKPGGGGSGLLGKFFKKK